MAHLRELLILDALSKNKDLQERYIEENDRNFDKLLAAIREQKLSPGLNRQDFIEQYGEPIYKTMESRQGQLMERWLYRYAVRYTQTKIYVYFDSTGQLSDWIVNKPDADTRDKEANSE